MAALKSLQVVFAPGRRRCRGYRPAGQCGSQGTDRTCAVALRSRPIRPDAAGLGITSDLWPAQLCGAVFRPAHGLRGLRAVFMPTAEPPHHVVRKEANGEETRPTARAPREWSHAPQGRDSERGHFLSKRARHLV